MSKKVVSVLFFLLFSISVAVSFGEIPWLCFIASGSATCSLLLWWRSRFLASQFKKERIQRHALRREWLLKQGSDAKDQSSSLGGEKDGLMAKLKASHTVPRIAPVLPAAASLSFSMLAVVSLVVAGFQLSHQFEYF